MQKVSFHAAQKTAHQGMAWKLIRAFIQTSKRHPFDRLPSAAKSVVDRHLHVNQQRIPLSYLETGTFGSGIQTDDYVTGNWPLALQQGHLSIAICKDDTSKIDSAVPFWTMSCSQRRVQHSTSLIEQDLSEKSLIKKVDTRCVHFSSSQLGPVVHAQHAHISNLRSGPLTDVASSSTSPPYIVGGSDIPSNNFPTGLPAEDLQIENGKMLYSGMTSMELLRTLFNLSLVAYEPFVDISIKILNSPLMKFALVRAPIHWFVKKMAYAHFCAGETAAEASVTLKRMWELGLKSILDYSLEDAADNNSCDQNLKEFLETVHRTRELPIGSVSFSCVKITALAPLRLLERVSQLIRWQHRSPGFPLAWKEDGLPLLAPSSPTYHVQIAPKHLTAEEEVDLHLAQQRIHKLCKICQEYDLPLLVDAEYTSVQPAIDYLTYAAALRFNNSGHIIVYGTIQAYLKDALPRLSLAIEAASQKGIAFGVKLVRGAYISRENAFAARLGASSPIHAGIQETHSCYDACAALMLEEASKGRGSVVLATHNIQSGKAAVKKAEELGLSKSNPKVHFAQLKGMADSLSLALVRAGFNVSKYLPFGPVHGVIPYLIRRAEENRGILGNSQADQRRIRQELRRRLQAWVGF
ncbi:hypothetical protein O6H91_12G036400 [Diphasiastrum complanatum]|uniref:Uncharacterized protein n=15 Tax=Diphasiastrum complanatum TaxID=34168 RepID=A0ACC2C0W2_DIPCM|nr:hypothetical protein O6H91_12G036400 [Diphasiastrum complanatum]